MPQATPKKLTLARLKALLSYAPETGAFTWRQSQGRCAAGQVAGRTHVASGGKLYWIVRVDGESVLAHRLAWFYMTGRWPFPEVDHQDGNGQNNRFANLEEKSRSENSKNLSLHRKSGTGVMGVRPRPGGRFEAAIFCAGVYHHLGMHDTLEAAAAARRKAEQEFNFHPHHGKPPATTTKKEETP